MINSGRKKKWRVPEWNLVVFAGLIGGGIGGLIARNAFLHHKHARQRKFYIFFAFGVIVDLLLFIVCLRS